VVPTLPQSDIISATMATIHTAKGDIEIELYPDDAPKTVKNFATLSKKGYYNGLTFHRVEPGFVIQGGDPNGNGSGGYSIYGSTFEDELIPSTTSYKEGYKEGVLAMANRGPNTNGSQFFIMLADNDSLPHAYTIFGKVTKGLEVVHQIAVGDKMTSIDVTE
jgi:cyclophilin family peptidyl-prolyl cis-trans isomerase